MDTAIRKAHWASALLLLAATGCSAHDQPAPSPSSGDHPPVLPSGFLQAHAKVDSVSTNGIWQNGLSTNGIWQNGIWQNGIWQNGLA
ncbi:MAG TPA: hypothetical protein VK762_34160, partial [Polyangiaceae bacterium]|nr:hypothetical protein [Polyangiaceae bacterium]